MQLTREQLQGRKEKAVRFVAGVLGDPDRAAEIEEESLEDYAARRRITLLNPEKGATNMVQTKAEIETENQELRAVIGKAHEALSDAYTPDATRGTFARAIGEVIENLEDYIEEEDEEEEGPEDEKGEDDEDDED